jgi:hypothetical protein
MLTACFQSDTSTTVPIASGFVPVLIILMIDGETLSLSFISAKEAMLLPMTKPLDMLANMKEVMKSRITIDPALYQRAKLDVIDLMAASEITGDHKSIHGTNNTLSVMLGGPGDTSLTLTITRNASTDFPGAGQDLIILMNSLRQTAAP